MTDQVARMSERILLQLITRSRHRHPSMCSHGAVAPGLYMQFANSTGSEIFETATGGLCAIGYYAEGSRFSGNPKYSMFLCKA